MGSALLELGGEVAFLKLEEVRFIYDMLWRN